MANKNKKILFRVAIYLAIIAAIFFFPKGSKAPPAPENGGTLPTVDDLAEPEAEEELADLSGAYPEVTAYFWARVDMDDGSQQVHVLLRFLRNVSELEWSEMKLRLPADRKDARDLAVAQSAENLPRPERGVHKIIFHIPKGAEPFKEGRIHCWIQDMCELQQGQRIGIEKLDETLRQLNEEDAKKEKARNDPPAESETDQ